MLEVSGPLGPETKREIFDLKGNSKCCDCLGLSAEWASVTYGTLICLDCAGKHRNLGVHVSFVKSMQMDSWTRTQIENMRQGGNHQLRDFFKKLEIDNSPIEILYQTKAAAHYKEKLKERVQLVLSGAVSSEIPSSKKSSGDYEIEHRTSNQTVVDSDPKDFFQVVFTAGSLGLTLSKDNKSNALVTKIVPGGPANIGGVAVGDIVCGVAGKRVTEFDEIMHMIPYMSRPLTVRFMRILTKKEVTSSAASHAASTSQSRNTLKVKLAPAHGSIPIASSSHSSAASAREMRSHSHASSKDGDDCVSPTNEHLSYPSRGDIEDEKVDIKAKIKKKSKGLKPQGNDVDDGDNATATKSSHLVPVRKKKGSKTSGLLDSSSVTCLHDVADPSQSRLHSEISSNGSYETLPHTNKSSPAKNENIHEENSTAPKVVDIDTDAHSPIVGGGVEVDDDVDHAGQEDQFLYASVDEDSNGRKKDGTEGVEDLGTKLKVEDIHLNDEVEREGEGDDEAGEEHEEDEELDNEEAEEDEVEIGVGTIVDVLQEDDDDAMSSQPRQWRTGTIRRIHKDDTLKVKYMDGGSESHIHSFRLRLSSYKPNTGESQVTVALQSKTEVSTNPSKFGYASSNHSSASVLSTYEAFVPDTNADIDAWLEGDVDGDEDPPPRKNTNNNEEWFPQVSSPNKEEPLVRGANIDYKVVFTTSPLGLTLARGINGRGEVSKIVLSGQACSLGVAVGDFVVGVNDAWMESFEEVMTAIKDVKFPLTLVMCREVFIQKGKKPMFQLYNPLSKPKQSVLKLQTSSRRSAGWNERVESAETKQAKKTILPEAAAKNALSRRPVDPREYDVVFEEGELGLRIEESDGTPSVSVVTNVTVLEQANRKGVDVGSVIIGINREAFMSHAHTVSTLKHSKRPLIVRFRRPVSY